MREGGKPRYDCSKYFHTLVAHNIEPCSSFELE